MLEKEAPLGDTGPDGNAEEAKMESKHCDGWAGSKVGIPVFKRGELYLGIRHSESANGCWAFLALVLRLFSKVGMVFRNWKHRAASAWAW